MLRLFRIKKATTAILIFQIVFSFAGKREIIFETTFKDSVGNGSSGGGAISWAMLENEQKPRVLYRSYMGALERYLR